MKKFLKIMLSILVLIIAVIILISISNIIKTPSHDRQWSEDSKILPSISVNENTIEVKNIRDWRYSRTEVLSKEYYNESFDLNKLEKTYYLINPFGKWNGVAHGFFLFVFEDGKSVSVSIEARREANESFNSIKGLFNKYELWYTYGSAADFITRRAVHYEDSELNMYPLLISKEMSQKLFLDLANETQSIEKEAKFYNTLKSNCTNLLMDSLNKAEKGTVPFHYSRLFTGYSDDYFYKLGLIPNDASFEEINKKFRIDDEVLEIDSRLKEYTKEEFHNELFKKQLISSPYVYPVNYENTTYDRYGVPKPSDEIIKYENNDLGIQFEYPSNYSVEYSKYEDYLTVDFPKNIEARGPITRVGISLTDMSYEEFRESRNYPDEYTFIIEEKEFEIDGKKAMLLISSTAIGLDVKTIFVEHNGKNFLVSYPEHPVQREIFNSIKFI